jgi:hypothetical protein
MKPLNWWSESYIKVWPFTSGLQTSSEARGVYRLAVDLILTCFRTSSIASLHLQHPKRINSVKRTTKRSSQSMRRTKTKTSNQPVKRAETKRPYLWEEKKDHEIKSMRRTKTSVSCSLIVDFGVLTSAIIFM